MANLAQSSAANLFAFLLFESDRHKYFFSFLRADEDKKLFV